MVRELRVWSRSVEDLKIENREPTTEMGRQMAYSPWLWLLRSFGPSLLNYSCGHDFVPIKFSGILWNVWGTQGNI